MSKQLYVLSFFNGQSEDCDSPVCIHGVSTDVEKLKEKSQEFHTSNYEDGFPDETYPEVEWNGWNNWNIMEGYVDEDGMSYYIIEPIDNYDD